MPQPIRKGGAYQKPRSKTVKKRSHKTEEKTNSAKPNEPNRLPRKTNVRRKHGWFKRPHPEYGTSKLEERFAEEFLEKLGVPYVYQFKAESIGRYYDFYLPEDHILIEVDGDYWHSYGVLYEDMTPTQKRNKRVDEAKDHWALINGIPLIRIWEHDINEHPAKVMAMLKDKLDSAKRQNEINKEMKRRH